MENPPSAPGGARGADHHYPSPTRVLPESDDVSSYPPTPATPAISAPKPTVPTPKHNTPPKIENPPPKQEPPPRKDSLAGLFSSPESAPASPIRPQTSLPPIG